MRTRVTEFTPGHDPEYLDENQFQKVHSLIGPTGNRNRNLLSTATVKTVRPPKSSYYIHSFTCTLSKYMESLTYSQYCYFMYSKFGTLPLKRSKKIHFSPHLNFSDNNQRHLEMTLKMESALKSPPVIGSLVYMTKSLLPLLGHDYLSAECYCWNSLRFRCCVTMYLDTNTWIQIFWLKNQPICQ